ncbi:MAG: nucleotide exchange factor GrpE [Candidatus Peribacteraceae bacterium]
MESKAKKPQGGKTPSPVAVPMDVTVRELEAQVKKLTDIAGRAQADLQNAKARLEKDAGELRTFATEGVLVRLLPVIDNFQRAFQHLPDDLKTHEWVKGVAAVEQELLRQVTELGLEKIDALGKPVDPAKHEVLMQGPGGQGMVTEVFQEGYELHGRVLRPAKVKAGDGTTNLGQEGQERQEG